MILTQVKKKSLYKRGQILRIPGGWGSQISRQSPRECGEVCQPYAPAAFNPWKYSWCSFPLQPDSTPGS